MVLHCAPAARGKGERGKRRLDAEGGGGGCEGRRVPHWLPAAARTPGGAARSRSVAPPAAGSGGERGAGSGAAAARPGGAGRGSAAPPGGAGGARRGHGSSLAAEGRGPGPGSTAAGAAGGDPRRGRRSGMGAAEPPGAAGRLLQVSAARCEVCQGAEKRQKPV